MSHLKLKLACFEKEKTCKIFTEKFSSLNLFITHSKPVKNKVKKLVSCTL